MKIPVGKTLEAAFNFFFKNFLSVLGTVWFPVVMAIVLIGGAAFLMVAGMHGAVPDPKTDAAAFGQFFLRLIPLILWALIVVIVTGAMVQVGLLRKALGLHPSPVFIYYSLGSDVWRMIGALFLILVITIGLEIGFVAACLVIYGIAHVALGEPGSYWIAALAGVVSFCACIYSIVRLSYFIPTIVVAEHHIGLGRSWELGRGNFWRIFLLNFVILLAVGIVAGMVQSIFMPPFMMNVDQHADFHELMRQSMAYLHTSGPVLAIVGIFRVVFQYGLMAGAAANAYRAVTSPPEGTQPA